jgi:diaminohydroxyphosphoribosylaminopyrimidine deaminase/5-amino-6-(5-phosphoribosylamino)uracil reductase
LNKNGIETTSGILADPAADLNRAFFCHARHKRPWVILKMAMTLDGRIATQGGSSQWITGPAARRQVQRLRQWADAVLVGAETVRCDNPSLLVRSPKNWRHQPLRLVATNQALSKLRLKPEGSPSMLTDGNGPVQQFRSHTSAAIQGQLQTLGANGVKALLVEGGGEIAGSFLQAGCIDEIAFFIAPRLLTGRDSRPVVGGINSPDSLAQCLQLHEHRIQKIGNDYLMKGFLTHVHRSD